MAEKKKKRGNNYKALAAGTYKNVFERSPNFRIDSEKKVSLRPNDRYVSSFLVNEQEGEMEIAQSMEIYRIDPYQIFTVQPQDWIVYNNPTQEQKDIFKILRNENYVYDIVYPFGGDYFSMYIETIGNKIKNSRDWSL